MVAKRFEYLEMQSRDSSTFNNTFQTLGSTFSYPVSVAKLVNVSDVDVEVSTDGTTSHDILPANSFSLYSENEMAFKKGEQIYVKGAAPGTGNVYLVAMREL